MTLPIPAFARNVGGVSGWRNIHEILGHAPPRLTGVDSLFGDTAAHTLIVGQDMTTAAEIEKRRDRGCADPYRHFERYPTNERLRCLVRAIKGVAVEADGSGGDRSGFYYANAHYLLKDGAGAQARLLKRRAAREVSRPVLAYIVARLRPDRIIAMGAEAYAAISELGQWDVRARDWRTNLNAGRIARAQGQPALVASSHLGAWGVRGRLLGSTEPEGMKAIIADWRRAFE